MMELFKYSLLLLCVLILETQAWPEKLYSSVASANTDYLMAITMSQIEEQFSNHALNLEGHAWEELRAAVRNNINDWTPWVRLCLLVWNKQRIRGYQKGCTAISYHLMGQSSPVHKVRLLFHEEAAMFIADFLKCQCSFRSGPNETPFATEIFYITWQTERSFFKLKQIDQDLSVFNYEEIILKISDLLTDQPTTIIDLPAALDY